MDRLSKSFVKIIIIYERIFIVLTTPREHTSDTSSYQTTESIRDLLDSKHSKSYMIYSLEQYSNEELSYQQKLFHDRV